MPPIYKILAVLLISVGTSVAKIEFSHSTMYDIFDFEGLKEIPLPRCDSGCLIFASTMSKYQPSYDGLDPYMNNLIINDSVNGRNLSITEIAAQYQQETSQKIPLDILASGKYSILNLNGVEEKGSDVTVWIIERARAHEFDYEIYDAVNMDRPASVPAGVVTVMSASPFRVIADPGETNSVTARLVGFDNALDDNEDRCNYVFKTTINSTFDGFNFQINAPIISLVFNEKKSVNLNADNVYVNIRDLSQPQFITSPGYNGCKVLGHRGQAHRSKQYNYTEEYELHGEPDSFRVSMQVLLDLADHHYLTIKDMSVEPLISTHTLSGLSNNTETMPNTQFVIVSYDDLTPPQTCLIRITATSLSIVTSTVPSPTGNSNPHCKCDMDWFDRPQGWAPTEIWLDVVIVLDTSEALSDASLKDAAALIESMLGKADFDVLTADNKAPFYTRVGVIAMSDAPEVLYNLNMTKSDSVKDKVTTRKGLAEIDLTAAFSAAQDMLADGFKPDRASTRQVIHFITDSQPQQDSTVFNEFKAAGGVIIVNNIQAEGEFLPKGSLKSLASDGYFLIGVEEYMFNVQALCKANCFCSGGRVPYAGDVSDPAVHAAGGCYRASTGTPYSKAKQACTDVKGGIIATVHDGDKGVFLNKLISAATPKQYFFWVGYAKGDDGSWGWEDAATDSYTNWAPDEPSGATVAKCAYVDQSSTALSWGAGNCQLGLPYACQYTPCSVGNKVC